MDASAGTTSNSQIFSINPYEDHPSLTKIEADVLWEYAKLNQHIKDVRYVSLPPSFKLLMMMSRSRRVPINLNAFSLPVAVGYPDPHFERYAGRSHVKAA